MPTSLTKGYALQERAAARGRVAGLSSTGPDHPALPAARRALTAAQLKAVLLTALDQVETLIEVTADEAKEARR
ncbi:hypothetical protein [Streptomyces erythrochromogenes]|uniref:hypothetical protein n=1 Tax=Streptomyces erythrochromogenes TaxID=285574 RepID=UPI00386F16D2|nr:hypothetical protein OG364_29540 [Streptomyces erythrochromogenes]